MSKYLWYLSEELVALCFFDDAVSFETKQHMFAELQDEDDEQYSLKKFNIHLIIYSKRQTSSTLSAVARAYKVREH